MADTNDQLLGQGEPGEVPGEVERFFQNMQDLITLIIELISDLYDKKHTNINPSLILLVKEILAKVYSKEDLLKTFIDRSYSSWDQIANREESFFTNDENCKRIFEGLPENYINSFKELFSAADENGDSIIRKDDKKSIWEFFTSFVKISIKHVHASKVPSFGERGKNFGIGPFYRKRVYIKVKRLTYYAKLYNIDLVFPKPNPEIQKK